MFDTLKQKWHQFEAEHLTPKAPEPITYHAVITADYLAGEANGKEFGRVAWQDIELVVINIEGDFEPSLIGISATPSKACACRKTPPIWPMCWPR